MEIMTGNMKDKKRKENGSGDITFDFGKEIAFLRPRDADWPSLRICTCRVSEWVKSRTIRQEEVEERNHKLMKKKSHRKCRKSKKLSKLTKTLINCRIVREFIRLFGTFNSHKSKEEEKKKKKNSLNCQRFAQFAIHRRRDEAKSH